MDSDAGVMKWKLFTQSSGRDKSTDFINKVLGKFVNESRVLISQRGTESPPGDPGRESRVTETRSPLSLFA